MKIKITKIEEPEDAEYKNHVQVGNEYTGEFIDFPKLGNCFYLDRGKGRMFRSSPVEKMIDGNIFKTNNSIYKIEKI